MKDYGIIFLDWITKSIADRFKPFSEQQCRNDDRFTYKGRDGDHKN